MSLISHRNKKPKKADPLTELAGFEGFESLFDHFFTPLSLWRRPTKNAAAALPWGGVDIIETSEAYNVKADLPGMKTDNINVTLSDGILTIEAKKEEQEEDKEEGRVIRKERCFEHYLRRFDLGQNISDADVTAEFKKGVLELKIPKLKHTAAEPKHIEIK